MVIEGRGADVPSPESRTNRLDQVYSGPVVTTTIDTPGRSLQLVRPGDPDRLLDEPSVLAWNRRDDYMPYWAYLWPGAFLLSEVVARREWIPGTRALEIGCGLGLAGLTGLSRGLCVTFSDYDEAPLEFVKESALANGFDASGYSTVRLDWREPFGERFEVILGADVLYERRLVPLVAGLLALMLAPGGVALIADPYRAAAEGFGACVRKLGLTCEAEAVSARSVELGTVRGTMHTLGRRA